ncbi:putative TonB-dependent receptor [Caenibius tardaugens NBRC 16725]|uniref:Putative TonB-dependent receptor n=2 Tax=Caenibius TaxID=2827482 RepID=U3A6A4_9SPHN|nr:putative TonB-dependent receptor [Caenibius tardaugens NBRC 16725]
MHMRFTTSKMALLGSAMGAIAACTVPAFAHAQETQPAGETAREGGLETIVVTARRRAENLQDTPVSITAFNAAKLETMNVQEVSKLANFTPGLELVPSGTTQGVGVSIRGIATYDPILTNEPSVGLYIDGIYVNALSYGQFDTLDLERVEVLRGPQGTLFGRNTTGGAINIVTRRPSDTFGVEAKASYATHNEIIGKVRIDTGEIAEGIKASLTYQYRTRDGYVDDITRPDKRDPGASRAHAIRAALHAGSGPFTLDYTFDMVRRRDYGPHNQFALVTDAYGAFTSQSPLYGGDPLRVSDKRLGTVNGYDEKVARNNSWNHALTLEYAASDNLTLKSITGHRKWVSHELSPFGSSSDFMLPLITDFSTYPFGTTVMKIDPYVGGGMKRLKQFTQEVQILGNFTRFEYVVGGYYYDAKYAEDNPQTYLYYGDFTGDGIPDGGVPAAGRLAYQGSTKSYALFGQFNYTPAILNDNLELTGGIRYTIDKKRLQTQIYNNGLPPPIENQQGKTFKNTSFNITANYKFTPDISAYARFGTGYRSGGFSPRAFDGSAYNPEKAKVYEFGIKSEFFDRRLRANLAIFRTDYSNLQITQPGFSDTAGFVSNVINAGKATYQGFEFELTAAPVEGLTLTFDVSYVDPKYKQFLYNGIDIKNDAKFGFVAKWAAHVGGTYEFPETSFGTPSISLDYSYKSSRVYESVSSDPIGLPDARDQLKGQARNDLSGRIALSKIPVGGAQLTLAVFGENLLDKKYRISTIDFGALGFGTAIYNRPRVIGIDAKVNF